MQRRGGVYQHPAAPNQRWVNSMAESESSGGADASQRRTYTKREWREFPCEGCAAAIRTRSPKQRFCSASCHNEQQKQQLPVCVGCGQRFKEHPRSSLMIATGKRQQYCSHACRSRITAIRAERGRLVRLLSLRRTCTVCASVFQATRSDQLYCFEAVCEQRRGRNRTNANSQKQQKARPSRMCPECGALFRPENRRRTYCSRRCAKCANREDARSHQSRARHYGVEREPINRIDVFRRDGWRCQVCGIKTPERLRGTRHDHAPELDHRVPLVRGGSHTYANVQCCCRRCNGAKGSERIVGQMNLFPVPCSR